MTRTETSLLERLVMAFAIMGALVSALIVVNTKAHGQEKQLPTGAKPTPAHLLLQAPRFVGLQSSALEKVAYIPQLHVWGNNRYGVCVSSEEAFNQGACGKFITEAVVIEFARKHGWLNGAYLVEVMEEMQRTGFPQDGKKYQIGKFSAVNYANEGELKAALSIAPVKIAMASGSLPSGAGKANGWYALGGRNRATDHCVAIAGYGPAKWLYEKLNVPLPAQLKPDQFGYLLFTWGTIGFVDHAWIMGTCVEAWVRDPSQVIDGKPSPNPGPQPTPPDPIPPDPSPAPVSLTEWRFDPASKSVTVPADWTVRGGKRAEPTIDEVLAELKRLIEKRKAKPVQEEFPQSKLPVGAKEGPIPSSLLASGMLVAIHESNQADLPFHGHLPYADARARAERDSQFLLTWIDADPPFSLPDAITTRASFSQYRAGAVVLSGPWRGKHTFYGQMDSPGREQLQAALNLARSQYKADEVRRRVGP